MGFGKSGKCHAEYIRCKRCDRSMLISIHDQTVINLIRENDQFRFSLAICRDLLPGSLSDRQRTCRIVRVDDNDSFCPVCDLASDILDIRIPVRLLHRRYNVRPFLLPVSQLRSTADNPVPGSESHLHYPDSACMHRLISSLTPFPV